MRSRPPLPRAALATLSLAALLLAGCGDSSSGNGVASKPPEAIVAAARSAADGAATVHISGSIVNEGKPLAMNLQLVANKGGMGRITIEGLSIDMIRVGSAVYLSGSKDFYRRIAGPTAARLLQGKWLKVPENSGNFGPLASLTDLGKLFDTALAGHGKLVPAGSTKVARQRAVGVRDLSNGATLYVASAGKPFPVELLKDGGGAGRISFDRWDQAVSLNAPVNAVNINQLLSGA